MSAMRDCDSFAEDLSAFVDGELDATRVAEIHVHLVACAACAREIARLRSADDALTALAARSTDAEAARVASVRSAIAAQIAAEDAAPQRRTLPSRRVPRRARSWIAPFVSGAVAASAGALLLWFGATREATQSEIAAATIESPPAAGAMEAAKARVVLQEPDAFAGRGASAAPEAIEGLAALSAAEREELEDALARWQSLPATERDRLRTQWRRFLALSPAERDRVLPAR